MHSGENYITTPNFISLMVYLKVYAPKYFYDSTTIEGKIIVSNVLLGYRNMNS